MANYFRRFKTAMSNYKAARGRKEKLRHIRTAKGIHLLMGRLQKAKAKTQTRMQYARERQQLGKLKKELFATRHPYILRAGQEAGKYVRGYAKKSFSTQKRRKRYHAAERYYAKRRRYKPKRRHKRRSSGFDIDDWI